MNGDNGGRYKDSAALVAKVAEIWGQDIAEPAERAFIVMTGGEPMLQVDRGAGRGATRRPASRWRSRPTARCPCRAGIDWITVSPKAGNPVVQRSGDELKLVWPQPGIDPDEMEAWDFRISSSSRWTDSPPTTTASPRSDM